MPELQTSAPSVWQTQVCWEPPVCQFCQMLLVKEQKNMRWGVREGMQDVKGTVLNAISGATAVNHVWQLQRLKPVPLRPIRALVAASEPAASEAPKRSVSAFWHPPRLNVTGCHWVLKPLGSISWVGCDCRPKSTVSPKDHNCLSAPVSQAREDHEVQFCKESPFTHHNALLG